MATEQQRKRRTVASSMAAWTVMSAVLVMIVLGVPQSIGFAIAALLIVGPLVVWAFRK